MSALRRSSIEVVVGGVGIGGSNPIRVQSMTDTITSDVGATVRQVRALAEEGSEFVRVSILDDADAEAIPEIRARLNDTGCFVPLVGDFHFNGHTLLEEHPACAKTLDKYRINPGNVGFGNAHDANFARIVEIAATRDKAVRIGANWGSLDETVRNRLLSQQCDWPPETVMEKAMIQSTLESAAYALRLGFPENKLVLSAKVSHVPSLLAIYRDLANQTDSALHLGLTEAGTGDAGIIASTAAMSVLLQEGIGDTVRVSITPNAQGEVAGEDPRLQEVRICQQILQSTGVRNFVPTVRSCPGCGRTNRDIHRPMVRLVSDFVARHAAEWRAKYPGSENMVIAVMGCVVNGIQEAKYADVGVSLPGRNGEDAVPMLFADGKSHGPLRGEDPGEQFLRYVQSYVESAFSPAGSSPLDS
jgi:(E)-4-hydroxy-3-methylbut-2-enyl-diphosphate synthase